EDVGNIRAAIVVRGLPPPAASRRSAPPSRHHPDRPVHLGDRPGGPVPAEVAGGVGPAGSEGTLGMDVLRCRTPAMGKKEPGAHLLCPNLIRRAMPQVALAAERGPRELSVAGGAQALASPSGYAARSCGWSWRIGSGTPRTGPSPGSATDGRSPPRPS